MSVYAPELLKVPPPDVVIPADEGFEIDAIEAECKGVDIALTEVLIKDVRDLGSGDVYLASVFADDVSADPVILNLAPYEDVQNGATLPIVGDGLGLYINPEGKSPRYVTGRLVVAESDKEIRDVGKLIATIREDEVYQEVVKDLSTAIAVGRPDLALVIRTVDYVFGVIGKILELNRDDQIIQVAGTFYQRTCYHSADPVVADARFAKVTLKATSSS